MFPVFVASLIAGSLVSPSVALAATTTLTATASTSVPSIPFYSQFTDISSPSWQKVGCGVTSLAMVIDYYSTSTISVNKLLHRGIVSGAYLKNAGWTYTGLIALSKPYGLSGKSYDLGTKSTKIAFAELKEKLAQGPVIASVHYKFNPASTIPHLVVINGIEGDLLYYNDPAAKDAAKTISSTEFLKAWKKRFIVIRPA